MFSLNNQAKVSVDTPIFGLRALFFDPQWCKKCSKIPWNGTHWAKNVQTNKNPPHGTLLVLRGTKIKFWTQLHRAVDLSVPRGSLSVPRGTLECQISHPGASYPIFLQGIYSRIPWNQGISSLHKIFCLICWVSSRLYKPEPPPVEIEKKNRSKKKKHRENFQPKKKGKKLSVNSLKTLWNSSHHHNPASSSQTHKKIEPVASEPAYPAFSKSFRSKPR